MKRVAFTIILNGLHHLKHNDYYKFMIDNFDLWVIAEGAVESRGSTSWCKKMPDNLHNNGRSVDGTLEFLTELSDNSTTCMPSSDPSGRYVCINLGIVM